MATESTESTEKSNEVRGEKKKTDNGHGSTRKYTERKKREKMKKTGRALVRGRIVGT